MCVCVCVCTFFFNFSPPHACIIARPCFLDFCVGKLTQEVVTPEPDVFKAYMKELPCIFVKGELHQSLFTGITAYMNTFVGFEAHCELC